MNFEGFDLTAVAMEYEATPIHKRRRRSGPSPLSLRDCIPSVGGGLVTAPLNGPATGVSPAASRGLPTRPLDPHIPQTSFSSAIPVEGSRQNSQEQIKGAKAGRGEVPWPLWRAWGIVIVCLLLSGTAALEIMLASNQKSQGWMAPAWIIDTRGFGWFFVSSVPLWITMVYSLLWDSVRQEVFRIQPLVDLSRSDRGLPAERTILLGYVHSKCSEFRTKHFWKEDRMVLAAIVAWILTFALSPLAGAIMWVDDVWWRYPATDTTRLTKLTESPSGQFMDMIAFQGASGFATAKVLFDVARAPFVTADGYAVEAFRLPDEKNGTVHASVSGVTSQAICVPPTSFVMTQESATTWHNVAWFDECQFPQIVSSVSSDLFGVETLPETAGCYNGTGFPEAQHRPVVFWFFSYEPEPIFSVVKCTPRVHANKVNVALELASNATGIESIGESITSIGDLEHPAFNGLFFNETMLGQEAASRLQGVRQQLPSAVFQAAKAKDPLLLQTFVYYGFTNVTADIYNAYLGLIAKSIYFVEEQDTISIAVSKNCKRVRLVSRQVHALAALLGILGLLAFYVERGQFDARKRFTIPPNFGTLATSIWLGADVNMQLALNKAYRRNDKGEVQLNREALNDCLFHLDKTGRIIMRRGETPSRSGSSASNGSGSTLVQGRKSCLSRYSASLRSLWGRIGGRARKASVDSDATAVSISLA
ncbi:hypothetical protein C8Q74DRAFT_1048366 [Fomes fomentarius]|nr:hypothetical protein C8Q74DRAFT_1048366 [Fomes fomentarius]